MVGAAQNFLWGELSLIRIQKFISPYKMKKNIHQGIYRLSLSSWWRICDGVEVKFSSCPWKGTRINSVDLKIVWILIRRSNSIILFGNYRRDEEQIYLTQTLKKNSQCVLSDRCSGSEAASLPGYYQGGSHQFHWLKTSTPERAHL